jgi:hypothetical protein
VAALGQSDQSLHDGPKVIIGHSLQQDRPQLRDAATMRVPRPTGVALCEPPFSIAPVRAVW